MKTLERFLTSAEANLCAAFLQNAGIDATVFEDSSLGDSIGAFKNSIRLVVPDEQFDEGKRVLGEYQKGDDVRG
ncbi:MAG: hypothetical protein ACI9UA_005167 [Pseudoalteromonas tetraodonis]|jgi:hypothetical protein